MTAGPRPPASTIRRRPRPTPRSSSPIRWSSPSRPADERLGQGDVADPERGRSRDDHALLDQPRHHRPEVRQPVPSPRARRSTSAPSPPTPSRARTWPTTMRDTSKVKSVYILDDTGAYGEGIANPSRAQAEEERHQGPRPRQAQPEGIRLHDHPDQDQGLNPDALFYGGVQQAGVKLAKQAYDIMPKCIKVGGDGMLDGGFLTGGASRRSRAGMYHDCRAASDRRCRQPGWVDDATPKKYKHDADATRSRPMTRCWWSPTRSSAWPRRQADHPRRVRDAMQTTNLKTCRDDLVRRKRRHQGQGVSVFQVQQDAGTRTTTVRISTSISAWRRESPTMLSDTTVETDRVPRRELYHDVLLQQLINGLSLGTMYALLALGFTMVYGIIELINFAHFNVFMVGLVLRPVVPECPGLMGQAGSSHGLPLVGVLLLVPSSVTMLFTRPARRRHRAHLLKPLRGVSGTAPMITTIGVSYILFNSSCDAGRRRQELPEPACRPCAGRSASGRCAARGAAVGRRLRADVHPRSISCAARGWARRCGRPPRTRKRPA